MGSSSCDSQDTPTCKGQSLSIYINNNVDRNVHIINGLVHGRTGPYSQRDGRQRICPNGRITAIGSVDGPGCATVRSKPLDRSFCGSVSGFAIRRTVSKSASSDDCRTLTECHEPVPTYDTRVQSTMKLHCLIHGKVRSPCTEGVPSAHCSITIGLPHPPFVTRSQEQPEVAHKRGRRPMRSMHRHIESTSE